MVPKEGGDYRSISLVKVLWKVVTSILNLCLTTSIAFHDVLHRFWECCVTGTASLESKLLQNHSHGVGVPVQDLSGPAKVV